MRISLFGIMLDGMVEMLELLIADPAQRGDELGELGADLVALGLPLGDHLEQGADLLVVVAPDLGLDGLGAGHGGLTAHDGGGPAEAGGEGGPERVEGSGTDAVLVDEGVEGVEVRGLLVVHVLHERAEVRVGADDRGRLRGVDERGGEFASLVDAEGRGEEVALLLGERLALLGRCGCGCGGCGGRGEVAGRGGGKGAGGGAGAETARGPGYALDDGHGWASSIDCRMDVFKKLSRRDENHGLIVAHRAPHYLRHVPYRVQGS